MARAHDEHISAPTSLRSKTAGHFWRDSHVNGEVILSLPVFARVLLRTRATWCTCCCH